MKFMFVGHSHLGALSKAWSLMELPQAEAAFVSLFDSRFWKPQPDGSVPDRTPGTYPSELDLDKLGTALREQARSSDCAIYVLTGNQHNSLGYGTRGVMQLLWRRLGWARRIKQEYLEWFSTLKALLPERQCVLLPPPPVESEAWIRANPGALSQFIKDQALLSAAPRLQLWKIQCRLIRAAAQRHGIEVHETPASIFSPSGFLAEDCRRSGDVAHANEVYGQRILKTLVPGAESLPVKVLPVNPYRDLRSTAYWRKAVSDVAADAVDPVINPPFQIGASDRIATAGSCFAQHISQRLMDAGCRFMRMEADEPGLPQYPFSARYGNVYTARQLLQLFDRAFGHFQPSENVWLRADGRYCDPFRPQANPDGFESAAAVQQATERHLAAVREMFSELDVLVFTLGLTECFLSLADGAVYPVAPGVAGGSFDEGKYRFANLSANAVTSDLTSFIGKLREINPKARMILTVSPVPLVATRGRHHVLVASSLAKAALRVAAANIESRLKGVYYFPSYEIITGPHARETYFESDRRSVSREGVDHVMRVFMSRMVQGFAATSGESRAPASRQPSGPETELQRVERLMSVICDEELNDAGLKS